MDFYFTLTFQVPGNLAEQKEEALERLRKSLESQPFDWILEHEEVDNDGNPVVYPPNATQPG